MATENLKAVAVGESGIVIVAVILGLVGLVFAVVAVINTIIEHQSRKNEELVHRESRLIPMIDKLNKEYQTCFDESLWPSYQCTKRHKTLAAFDRATQESLLLEYVEGKETFFKKIIKAAQKNELYYREYCARFEDIVNGESVFECEKLQKIEQNIVRSKRMSPITKIVVDILSEYISPGGRSHHTATATVGRAEIEKAIYTLQQQRKRKQTAQYQRTLMTPSLRYDVMKRDGFRCVLCGMSQEEDGAKLHVDHIIPVSKGGKTEMSNLRTLCDWCNLGKRDKYDPNGIN